MGELTFHAEKLHVAECSRKPVYMFSFSTANYFLKLDKKHSIKAVAHGIITRHHIIRYRTACELVPPVSIWSVSVMYVHIFSFGCMVCAADSGIYVTETLCIDVVAFMLNKAQ